jgi:2-polyprenyl-3-methyl-5-hydroxy-6-metoxy-1,4-benzoquinol methylase
MHKSLPYNIIMLVSSKMYWKIRYACGGNSGAGSYNRLAEFKAEIINDFVKKHNIQTVMEFGCGDGNQLSLGQYPQYMGFDISKTAIKHCKKRFKNDSTKTFAPMNEYANDKKAELVLSLDVIYHLIEDKVFEEYTDRLFNASTKFVIIYSSNSDGETTYHVKSRKFTSYIEKNIKGWNLLEHIPNKWPFDKNDPDNTSGADFYIYSIVNSPY